MRLLRLSILALAASVLFAASPSTSLDEYVARPDNHYKWELKGSVQNPAGVYYLLELTSQQWRSDAEVVPSIWKHWLSVYKPIKVTSSTALLTVNGGSINSNAPKPGAEAIEIATTTGSVVVELRGIPNEPVVFAGETEKRNEDGIIAYTWRQFLKTGDGSWPLRLPMTKAVVRAMDAVTEFLAKENIKVDHYVIAGASKRGWTTWTTAAVDRRVVAISPIVIDTLNVVPSFIHHYRAYGFWAPAVKDYYDEGLMDELDNPKYKDLMAIEDPYSYRARLTMPKYLINSAGDQFFLPDSSQFYFDSLEGEKYLRYIPNTDHSLKGADVWQSVTAFYDSVLKGQPRPRFHWTVMRDGALRVTVQDEPSAVKLWQATNPKHRDFRLESVGPIYTATDLQPIRKGVYQARPPKPATGFTAYFIELTFPSSGAHPFKFTTPVRVIPDELPFPAPKPGETKIGPQKPTLAARSEAHVQPSLDRK